MVKSNTHKLNLTNPILMHPPFTSITTKWVMILLITLVRIQWDVFLTWQIIVFPKQPLGVSVHTLIWIKH